MRFLGIVLLVLGLAGIAYGGLSWTRQKTVVDAGPIQVTKSSRETLPIPPLLGIVSAAAGVWLLVSTRRV